MTLRQALRLLGFTHASSVIPVVRCSAAASLTVTQSLVPLKSSAPPMPVRPCVQVAPVIVPVLPLPETSLTIEPEPSLNPYAAISPPSARTVTVTPAPGVSRLPVSSYARLRIVADTSVEPGPEGVQL